MHINIIHVNIDSLAFDSNEYIKKVKKEYNMKSLLKENNKLTSGWLTNKYNINIYQY